MSVRFKHRELDVLVVDGVSFTLARGRGAVPAGRVRVRQNRDDAGPAAVCCRIMRGSADAYVRLAGQDVLAMSERQLQAVRGPVAAMIFQEPMTALDPVFTIGTQIAETIVSHEGVLLHCGSQTRAGSAGAGADPLGRTAPGGLSARACPAACGSAR